MKASSVRRMRFSHGKPFFAKQINNAGKCWIIFEKQFGKFVLLQTFVFIKVLQHEPLVNRNVKIQFLEFLLGVLLDPARGAVKEE